MKILPLVYALHPILRQKATIVEKVDEDIISIVDNMVATMYFEGAIGIGANMVGILKRIAVVDLQEEGKKAPYILINPQITWCSDELQTIEESSLCFPGISAKIARPRSITIRYIDRENISQELTAEGLLATVIQHEVDCLDGKIYLDYLSKLKRDMLISKMNKYLKMHPPHIHSENCKH